MKKNDKLIVILGVVILVIASIGVYYWVPEAAKTGDIDIEEFFKVTGKYSQDLKGTSITVPDTDPFYPLIATPLAVHYDGEGVQEIIPMYVKNLTNPSDAIEKLQYIQLNDFEDLDLEELSFDSSKDFSLDFAKEFWDKSDAALIIEDTVEGYCLGLNAVPMASYLSIPVIVCDEIDGDVTNVLNHLEVTKVMICGDELKGYHDSYEYLKFDNVDQIIENATILIREKFDELDYITITNPIDAYPPKVIDEPEEFYFGPETIGSSSMNSGSTLGFVMDFFTNGVTWEFTIPDDYKYALIELEGYNHELDGVDKFGDSASFTLNPVGEGLTLGGVKTAGGMAKRDARGNIIEDSVYTELVLYDCGGKTYTLSATGSWTLLREGEVSAKITVKKLDGPIYPFMKGLSGVAPYLTAYHKGIIFSDPNFAFAADDHVRTDAGKTCPGFYLPGRNPDLFPMSNKHVYDNIHQPINRLLAKLADLDYERDSDIERLQKYYKDESVYIAIVGGATVLPRYVYQNEVEPIGDVDGDGIDDTVALNFGGGGTQSDNIYGNIDPIKYDWSNEADDIYSDYPFIENIVGRITGWDIQDADAMIVRTMFYNDILEDLDEWKNNYGNLFGGGLDFRKPLWVQVTNNLPVLKQILKLVQGLSGNFLNYAEGPWKYDTGFSRIMAKAVEDEIGNKLDFDVTTALHEAAMVDGLSDEALDEIKATSLWNKLTFSKNQVKELAGEGNVMGREVLENSNFIWATGHGSPFSFGMDGVDLVTAGFDGVLLNAPNLWQNILENTFSPHFVSGFWGPGGGLGKVGEYSPREIATVDLGPSFVWIESCFCGKITGIYPETNIGQTFIHSGANTVVASTTGSNIPGGYLDEKKYMWDTKLGTKLRYNDWEKKADQGIYPEFHFGVKIYEDMCNFLADDDATMGEAFRDAKNIYLPEDADWKLWWSPPLTATSSSAGAETGYGTHLAAKYTSFHEYVLYGDPAFNPYEPVNEG